MRYFLAVAEEGQFSRAADRLRVAQSTISEQIRALEAELSAELFVRSSRSVILTAAGERLQTGSQRILKDVQELRSAVEGIGAGVNGQLRIGAIGPALATVVPQVLRTYVASFPNIDIRLTTMSTDAQIEALLAGDLDVGFVREIYRRRGVNVETVLDEPLIAVLPSDHPLASRHSISLSALDGEPFILWPRMGNSAFFDRILGACSEMNCTPGKIITGSDMQTQLALISAGLGVSVQPVSFRASRSNDVAFVPIHDLIKPVAMQVAWVPSSLSPATRSFIGTTRETQLPRFDR